MIQDTIYSVCQNFVGSGASFPWFDAICVFLIGTAAGMLLVAYVGIAPGREDTL